MGLDLQSFFRIEAEELERQRMELQEARPAVEFVERYVEAKANQPIRMVAKVLGSASLNFWPSARYSASMTALLRGEISTSIGMVMAFMRAPKRTEGLKR